MKIVEDIKSRIIDVLNKDNRSGLCWSDLVSWALLDKPFYELHNADRRCANRDKVLYCGMCSIEVYRVCPYWILQLQRISYEWENLIWWIWEKRKYKC